MPDSSSSFDPTLAPRAIRDLLSKSPPLTERTPVVVGQTVVTLATSEFSSPENYLTAYQATTEPTLCLVQRQELARILPFLRDTDDVAIVGESPQLTQWRLDRLARAYNHQVDPLTGVFSREHLVQSLSQISTLISANRPLAAIVVDVDRLKAINDRHGPLVGNRLLKQLGGLLLQLFESTLVARTRGGEFVIAFVADETTAAQVASHLQAAIEHRSWSPQQKFTVSLGVASIEEPGNPSVLLKRLDEALFSAKASGRNCIATYSQIAAIAQPLVEQSDAPGPENRTRVMTERVASFVSHQSRLIMQNLKRQANTDALTQLFNRRYLDNQLKKEVQRAHREKQDLCVALVDVDHFGLVNKTHGWPTGDEVLRNIARAIQTTIRAKDWVGRYGGEELCIVMPSTRLPHALQVCERVRETVQRSAFSDHVGDPVQVTLSAGVVQLNHDLNETVEIMLQRVSDRTLEAKRKGRNRVCG